MNTPTPQQSDTPRTDAMRGYYFNDGWWVKVDFVRTLERELSEALARLAELEHRERRSHE